MSEPANEKSLERAAPLAARGAVGGVLMGLANLVPGVSGGTMLLAAGVYPAFIAAIAEVTTLRFRARSLVLLASVVGTAVLAILLLAGAVKGLVQDHRWIMYSLFIGLTLGGVPLLWRMARPMTPALCTAAVLAIAAMVAMAFGGTTHDGGERNLLLIFLAGVAASSAMILPGVSGGYLLLLLGQYEQILGTVDQIKQALLGDGTGSGPDLALLVDALHVAVPLGLGIAVGVVGVSNLLRWLLVRAEKATLGALLGLLLGAVVGLWPFQEGRAPEPGDVVKGRTLTAETAREVEVDDWPVVRFAPSPGQAGGALGLIVLGLAATTLLGRVGGSDDAAD